MLLSESRASVTGINARVLPSIGLPEWTAVAILTSLYSYLVYYLFGQGLSFLQPSYIYALIYLAGAFTYATSANARRAIVGHTRVVAAWLVLVLLMSMQFFFHEIGPEGVGLFVGRIHFLLTLISMLLILSACARFDFVVAALGWVIAASCAINIVEFFLGGSVIEWLSNVPGRAAGLFENSNDSAMFICMGIPIVAFGMAARTRWLLYAVTILGVYVTFSRGGLVNWAVFVAATELVLGYGKRGWETRTFLVAVAMLGVACTLSFFSAELTQSLTKVLWPYLDANTLARIEFQSSESTDARMDALQLGFEAFSSAPIFGRGIGYTYSWELSFSVHNMIVLVLAELGLLGGIWFGIFFLSLWRYERPYGATVSLVILVTGFFTHNHFERPAVAIAIALYLVAARNLTAKRRASAPHKLVGAMR